MHTGDCGGTLYIWLFCRQIFLKRYDFRHVMFFINAMPIANLNLKKNPEMNKILYV